MYDYFEEKKRRGLIFTLHNIDPNLPYDSIDKKTGRPIKSPGEPTWWSRSLNRYRNADEQRQFIESGCIDKRLYSNPKNAHLERKICYVENEYTKGESNERKQKKPHSNRNAKNRRCSLGN